MSAPGASGIDRASFCVPSIAATGLERCTLAAMTFLRCSLSRPCVAAVVALLAFGALLLGAERAEAQTLSLTGGMTLLLGPPDAQAQAGAQVVLGTPQDGQGQAAPPQQQTVYIVETQAPPGYGQAVVPPAGYAQPGAVGGALVPGGGQSSQEVQAESNGLVPRLILEPLMGALVGWSFAAVGLLVGLAASDCLGGGGIDSCLIGMIVGTYTGFLVGIPLGVTWAGGWFGGMGGFGSAFLGTLAGTALAVLVAALAQDSGVAMGIFVLPVAGAMIGYELSSSANARAATTGIALTPIFDRGAFTGGTAGVRVTF
jgi:hypothetical protein